MLRLRRFRGSGASGAGVWVMGDRHVGVAFATASLVVLVYALLLLRPWRPEYQLVANDFRSFWTGASLVRQGVGPALYDMETQRALQVELRMQAGAPVETGADTILNPYHNPPPLALLLVPFTLLPAPLAALAWGIVSLLAMAVAVAIPLRGSVSARATAVALTTFPAVWDTLLWSQVNGLFLLSLSLGLLALASGRPMLGGVLLGVLWLKPQYAVLFPLVFLVKGRWRELAGLALAGLFLGALSLAMVGFQGVATYLEVLRRIGSFYPPASSSIAPEDMVNWRAFLMHFWPELPDSTGSELVLVLGAATALGSLLAWRGRWDPSSPRFPRQVLVTVLATLVASPHSHFAGMALLLAPLAMAMAKPLERGEPDRALSLCLVSGSVLALVIWPFSVLSWMAVPYSVFAMGLLTSQLRGPFGRKSDSVSDSPASNE